MIDKTFAKVYLESVDASTLIGIDNEKEFFANPENANYYLSGNSNPERLNIDKLIDGITVGNLKNQEGLLSLVKVWLKDWDDPNQDYVFVNGHGSLNIGYNLKLKFNWLHKNEDKQLILTLVANADSTESPDLFKGIIKSYGPFTKEEIKNSLAQTMKTELNAFKEKCVEVLDKESTDISKEIIDRPESKEDEAKNMEIYQKIKNDFDVALYDNPRRRDWDPVGDVQVTPHRKCTAKELKLVASKGHLNWLTSVSRNKSFYPANQPVNVFVSNDWEKWRYYGVTEKDYVRL